MASKAMGLAGVCPTEDFVATLLEYLVDPRLPGIPGARGAPSKAEQEVLAKQVHAVVLLYNYYHRKHHPQLEFLVFEGFCKLAVILRPALRAHLRLLQRSNDTESQPVSLMEERIMEACMISMNLDASEDDLNIDDWPISKVAVLLVDSRKENCLLQNGYITEGVWSVIEKDVDVSSDVLQDAMDSDQVIKKKRIIKKPLKSKPSSNEAGFQQLAFSAVKEATGIDSNNLVVLESNVTYSTSKEKTAAYFYIMQSSKPDSSIAIQTPIKDAIDSLRGPLVIKDSNGWMHMSAVEYFHLLPYAGILSDWLSRDGVSNSVPVHKVGLETISVNSSNMTERSCEAEIYERSHNHVKDLSDCSDKPQKMDVDEFCASPTENKHKRKNVSGKDQPETCQKKTNTAEKCLKGSTSDDKVDMVDQSMNQKIAGCDGAVVGNGNKICSIIAADQDMVPITDHAVISYQSNSNVLDKLHTILASKDEELSNAALTAILWKRAKLSLQQRDLEDQIVQCDKDMETILKGGEDSLSLKIESLIERCNHVCLRSVSQERAHEDQCSPSSVKRKRLPDTVNETKNSCQELDDVCYQNNWILPTYHLTSQDGGFQANVTVKGTDFKLSCRGDLHPRPHEARESAATQMLAELRNMPNISW